MVLAVIQVGHEKLQDAAGISCRGRNGAENGFEKWLEVFRSSLRRRPGHALLGHAVENGKIQLVLRRVQVDEQVVDLVHHLLGACVTAIDLVDHHDGRQFGFERLVQHVARLRQGALAGIHQQQHPVDELQGAFHLAAEVTVAGRIDDINSYSAIRNGGVFRQDGDAALPLELAGVHNAFHRGLAPAENATLPEHGVYQRGLAMVNVRDDGDVPNR